MLDAEPQDNENNVTDLESEHPSSHPNTINDEDGPADQWITDLVEHTRTLAASLRPAARNDHGSSRAWTAFRVGLGRLLSSRSFALVGASVAISAFVLWLPIHSESPYPPPSILSAPTTQTDSDGIGTGAEKDTDTGGGSSDSPGPASSSAVPLENQGADGNAASHPELPGELAAPGQPTPGRLTSGQSTPAQLTPRPPMPEEPTPRTPIPATPTSTVSPTPSPITPTSTSPNPLVSPGVKAERTVQLSTQAGQESVEIDSWRKVPDKSGDLLIDQNEIYTALGAKLAIIEDSSELTYARCAQVSTWTTRIDFTTLSEDSRLCVRSREGSYGILQVHALPSSPGSDGQFVFHGQTWYKPAAHNQPPRHDS